ncbi:uncharacterized protein LOC123307602 [Coccinella septempunctata]|uniref:uncharacterized protein LOC123307602 n=1 Tax=Coccinella septempunctata TaxID=41139 RepID=UPI001D089F6E|nr:uncharacterized protein LOC123307602 [Coccinella septempunctata]
MSFSRSKSVVIFQYNIEGSVLGRVTEYRDLGVLFDQRLTFVPHVRATVSDGLRTLGFIIRNSRDLSETGSLFLLFTALVRSKLEYGCVVWNPGYKIHIESLEKIQRRFLKYVSFKIDGVYPCRGIQDGYLLSRFNVNSFARP